MIVCMAANGRVNKIGTKGARLYSTDNTARRQGRSIVSFLVTLDGRMYITRSLPVCGVLRMLDRRRALALNEAKL